MVNNDFAKEIVRTIKEKKLEPKPKRSFLLREYLLWFLGVFSMSVGALSFAVILYMINSNDWEYHEYLSGSFLGFLFKTLPYFWILLMLVFGFLIYFYVRHTKKGYKYQALNIIIIITAGSVLFGGALFAAGAGQAIDRVMYEKMPRYGDFGNLRYKMWQRPHKGMLVGQISEFLADDNFFLQDFQDRLWNIDYKGALVAPMTDLTVGEQVRVIGRHLEENTIEARVIGPDKGVGDMIMNRLGKPKTPLKEGAVEQGRVILERIREWEEEKTLECQKDSDCRLPFDKAIRSNCPFEAVCLEGICESACFDFGLPTAPVSTSSCQNNQDCDCRHYLAEDRKDCLCVNRRCAAIVD